MTMLERLRSSKTGSDRAAMQRVIDSPSTGDIKRRWLTRKLLGVVSVGPQVRAGQDPIKTAPDPQAKAHRIEDVRAIDSEIAQVDARIAAIGKVLEKPPRVSLWNTASYESQELRSELQSLRHLRRSLESDRAAPITRDRDGKPLTARQRAYRRVRAAELADHYAVMAGRSQAEGEHRDARRWRLMSMRSRQLTEEELGWRRVENYM